MSHAPHSHGCHGLSAVCFVQYDKNEHTPTRLLSPHYDPIEGYNMEYIENDITEGSLIVFPSNIIHDTIPSQSEHSRIILSMNITP